MVQRLSRVKSRIIHADALSVHRQVAVFFALLSLIVTIGFVGFRCLSTSAFANPGDDVDKDLSLYKISSGVAAYYEQAHSDDEEGSINENFNSYYSSLNFVRAGAFYGFVDEDYDSGWFGSTISKLSSAQQSRNYSSLYNYTPGLQYASYGYALQSMGLDSTANETFDIGAIMRFFLGIVMILFYMLAVGVDVLFGIIISVLKWMNPFKWFAVGGEVAFDGLFGGGIKQSSSIISDVPGMSWLTSGFDGIRGLVSQWYTQLQYVAPVFIVLFFFIGLGVSLILWNKTSGIGSKTKRMLLRLGFIFFSVPLLGNLYTSCLEYVSWAGDKPPMANTVINSTFVDFENWASKRRLSLPVSTNINVNVSNGSIGVDGGASSNPRTLSRLINTSVTGSNAMSGSNDNEDGIGLSIYKEKPNVHSGGGYENRPTVGTTGVYLGEQNTQFTYLGQIVNMLGRYTTNAFYHASDFESEFKKHYASMKGFKDTVNLVSDSDQYKDGEGPGNVLRNGADGKGGLCGTDEAKACIFLADDTPEALTVDMTDNSSDNKTDITMKYYNNGSDGGKGFTTLSMYNYLTTSFTGTSIILTSANKASSMFVQQSHHSVNLIGGSKMGQLLYYVNGLVMLMVLSMLGIHYALAMLLNTITRGFRFVLSMPMSMLGHMRSMARSATLGLMMVVEVLGTAMLYSLACTLFIDLNQIIETPLNNAFKALEDKLGVLGAFIPGVNPETLVVGAGPISFVLIQIGLVFIIWLDIVFLKKAIGVRKAVIRSFDEAMGHLMDRLFPADNKPDMPKVPGGGAQAAMMGSDKNSKAAKAKSALGDAAAGAAMGAGLGAAHNAMNRQRTGSGDAASGGGSMYGGAPGIINDQSDGPDGDGSGQIGTNPAQDEKDGKRLLESGGGLGSDQGRDGQPGSPGAPGTPGAPVGPAGSAPGVVGLIGGAPKPVEAASDQAKGAVDKVREVKGQAEGAVDRGINDSLGSTDVGQRVADSSVRSGGITVPERRGIASGAVSGALRGAEGSTITKGASDVKPGQGQTLRSEAKGQVKGAVSGVAKDTKRGALHGAAVGGVVGAVRGIPGGPAGMAAGAASGAAMGAVRGAGASAKTSAVMRSKQAAAGTVRAGAIHAGTKVGLSQNTANRLVNAGTHVVHQRGLGAGQIAQIRSATSKQRTQQIASQVSRSVAKRGLSTTSGRSIVNGAQAKRLQAAAQRKRKQVRTSLKDD